MWTPRSIEDRQPPSAIVPRWAAMRSRRTTRSSSGSAASAAPPRTGWGGGGGGGGGGRRILGLEQFELRHDRGASSDVSRITRLSYHRREYVELAIEAQVAWR